MFYVTKFAFETRLRDADGAVRVFIEGLFRALETSDAKGFDVPQAYFEPGAPPIRLRVAGDLCAGTT